MANQKLELVEVLGVLEGKQVEQEVRLCLKQIFPGLDWQVEKQQQVWS